MKKKSMSENSGDRSLKSSLQDWLKAAGAVVGIASAASFALTAVYDWGFFGALGLKLSVVPTTLSDHLRGALNWMPATLVSMISAVVVYLIQLRLDRGQSEEQVIAKSRTPRLARFGYKSYWLIAVMLVVAGPLYYLKYGDSFYWMFGGTAFVIWLLFASWLIAQLPLAKLNRIAKITILMLPAILILIYFKGRGDSLALRYASESTKVQLAGQTAPVPVTVIRTIDKGLLVFMKGGTEVHFIPWAQVAGFVNEMKPTFEGLAAKGK